MPSKKQRAKAKKQQVRSSFEFLDHKKDTPHMKKLQFARARYLVQKMLGRPIKKYNLLYTNDDGDWFSSEDDLTEGLILNVLRAKQVLHPTSAATPRCCTALLWGWFRRSHAGVSRCRAGGCERTGILMKGRGWSRDLALGAGQPGGTPGSGTPNRRRAPGLGAAGLGAAVATVATDQDRLRIVVSARPRGEVLQ